MWIKCDGWTSPFLVAVVEALDLVDGSDAVETSYREHEVIDHLYGEVAAGGVHVGQGCPLVRNGSVLLCTGHSRYAVKAPCKDGLCMRSCKILYALDRRCHSITLSVIMWVSKSKLWIVSMKIKSHLEWIVFPSALVKYFQSLPLMVLTKTGFWGKNLIYLLYEFILKFNNNLIVSRSTSLGRLANNLSKVSGLVQCTAPTWYAVFNLIISCSTISLV